jgi:ssDNA-binding Zn-finger/Zn-ribbon topoisomerase 1
MALKQLESKSDMQRCPRCGRDAVVIDGRFVRWLNCPGCKFKKLLEKEDTTTNVRVRDV